MTSRRRSKLGCMLGILVSTTLARSQSPVAAHPDPSHAPFPDFGFMIPADQAPGIQVFKLSQSYPTQKPEPESAPFFKTDFKTDWRRYLMQVRDYCFEGNIGNPDLEKDFRVENNPVRKWYHMPWQHYGANGREGYHGLTKEAPIKVGQLAPTQEYATGGAWAVGFFNAPAGWMIGQVWKDHAKPDKNAVEKGFPVGSVFFKLLFTSIPKGVAETQVPFLRNGVWWDAYATYDFNSTDRGPIRVVLTQMDIMVRDDRAPYGWVLGNFQFNGQAGGKLWENLVPVGLMWGQDSDNRDNPSAPFPLIKTPINPALKETIINPDTKELPPTHLGWNGRLNGPLDNPMSSCFSCHSTAQYPQSSALSPLFDPDLPNVKPGDDIWMRWFRNLPCGSPFNEKSGQSMDFCLQLAESLQNFDTWKHGMDGLNARSYGPESNKGIKTTSGRLHSLGRRNQ